MEKTALQMDFGTLPEKLSLSSAHRVQHVQARLQEGACLANGPAEHTCNASGHCTGLWDTFSVAIYTDLLYTRSLISRAKTETKRKANGGVFRFYDKRRKDDHAGDN